MGVPSAVVVMIGRKRNAGLTLRTGIAIVLVPALLSYLGMLGYARVIATRTGISLVFIGIMWLIIPLGAVIQVTRSAWQGVGAWRTIDFERFSGAGLRIAGIILLAAFSIRAPTAFVMVHIGAILVGATLLIPGLRSLRTRVGQGREGATLRSLFAFSLSAWPTTIFLYAGSRLDQALMPAAGNSYELGLYAVAVTVAEVPMVAATLVARDAIQHRAVGHSVRQTLVHTRIYWGALMGLCVAIIACVGFVTPIVFGDQFAASIASTRVLAVNCLASAALLFCVACLEGAGWPKLGSVGPLASMLVTIIGFAATWGAVTSMRASLIALISQTFGALVSGLLLWRVNGQPSSVGHGEAYAHG